MMDVNYFGTLYAIQSLLPGMIARGSGHIVNLSSVAGILGVYGYSAYGPTKFAIRGLSDTLRYELAEHGIRVSVVFPPDTQTPQLEYENQYKPPLLVELDKNNKVLSAETVAKSILKGVARGQYIITPGFDSTLYYQLTNFFGLVYPVMEFMVAQARRAIRAGGLPCARMIALPGNTGMAAARARCGWSPESAVRGRGSAMAAIATPASRKRMAASYAPSLLAKITARAPGLTP
jgi:3-dehydrosphinganine reductase